MLLNEIVVEIFVEDEEEVKIGVELETDIDLNVEDIVYVTNTEDGMIGWYGGEYNLYSSLQNQILETKNKGMKDNVTIFGIPVYEVDNGNGMTVIIGG